MVLRVVAPKFVAGVVVKGGVVRETAPILKRLRGQPVDNLYAFARNIRAFVERVEPPERER